MWRLPGNTCFEKPNIYPCTGENPRLTPKDNPTSSWFFGPPGDVGRTGGVLQARRPIRLLYIPDKWSTGDLVFNTQGRLCQGHREHSWDSYSTKDQLRADLQGRYCQHYLLPWVAISDGITGKWLEPHEFGLCAVLFLDITSLTFHQKML